MKLIATCCTWLLLCCLPLCLFGQQHPLSKAYLTKTYAFYKNTDPNLNHLNYFEAMAGAMHLSAPLNMVLAEESTGEKGYVHYKYQQFYAGVPIFGNHYSLHEKDGRVVTATGQYSPQVDVSIIPGMNAATAVAFAKQAMHAREYDLRKVEPLLCLIDPAFPQVSETLRLAYQVDLHSTTPFDKRRYFVDASSGKIITHLPLILREGVPSTAKTRYYGLQHITTDSIAPQQFALRDLTRGNGIFINNSDGGDFTSTSSAWDLTNDQKDEVALDAHYCTQAYYDMMLADYNWQGQDGNGKALIAYVHEDDNFTNAYWDGEATRYGDGDCNYGPLTTLEVVGHEFTHGMVDYTSKLVYEDEAGAINESLADMFGKLLEHKTDPANFSWVLGHSFRLSPDAAPFRVMDDPNSLEMPAYYHGNYWTSGNDPHVNSAIGNLWFSMLVDGKQGVNEVGTAFQVPALGTDKVGQIIFQVNRNYLTENSNYTAFYQYSVEAAEMLYGSGSTEAQAVIEAWKAVGLPSAPSTTLDLAIEGDIEVKHVCAPAAYFPVTFRIINSGNVAYNPAMMATVTLSSDLINSYTVHLTSPIGPGETFEIHVDDWLVADGFEQVEATLNLNDENPDNNYTEAYYSLYEFAAKDLGFFVYADEKKCFDTAQHINMYINNSSCEAVPAGSMLTFTAKDDLENLVWSSTYTLTEELPGGGFAAADFDVPLANSPLTYTLIYPDDPNLDNNESYDYSTSYKPIINNYLNTFEVNYGQDDYLELPYNVVEANLLYQNTHYFASNGEGEDPDEFERCADVLGVFNYEYAEGLNAVIHTCLDFSTSAALKLEFDLVQFRNSTNYLQSSMFQASWKGAGSGNLIVYGQQEGVVKHHVVSLPPFFKGALDLKFYTELDNGSVNPTYFEEGDFVLLDNLQLSAQTSGTAESTTQPAISISPNPAREAVNVQATGGIRSIGLQNASGQTLRIVSVHATDHVLDLKGLANGFYLLHIQLENGQQSVRKIVKMD